ncbi:vacuolar-sorting receptor [Trifolium repens]|nr:vacuolar-sorting receptor [Trifolium repens]
MNSLLLTSFNSYTLVLLLSECAGKLSEAAILKVICACFQETIEPPICLNPVRARFQTKVNSAVRNLIRNNSIVYGGGSTEIACSVAVEEATNIYPEVEQLKCRKYYGVADYLYQYRALCKIINLTLGLLNF